MEIEPNWVKAAETGDVRDNGTKLFRHSGKQIAIFHTSRGFLACNNRCPHQGYPLSEGCLTEDGILTCNWHNWKFDLADGTNLKGSDSVRVYPVQIRGTEIWIDLQDPPYEQQYDQLVANLQRAIRGNSYEHIARELCRLQLLGVDLSNMVAKAIEWSHVHLQYGWTHAYAGAADWLTLYDEYDSHPKQQLICMLEAIGHIADDTLRRPRYEYCSDVHSFNFFEFLEAIENEDEPRAIAMVRGALADGMHFPELEETFSTAALAHYNDFGHALIYVSKASQLIDRLGAQVELPLLLSLTRTLCYTTREDQIPQFRHYGPTLELWESNSTSANDNGRIDWRTLKGQSIDRSLDLVLANNQQNDTALYAALLKVNAHNMLHFNLDLQDNTTNNVDDNVGWLSFTHTFTFANAAREQCTKFPSLWPQALLQLACFSGRNSLYVDTSDSQSKWFVNDTDSFFSEKILDLFDHGKEEFIVSVHLLKTLLAARQECREGAAEVRNLVSAAINRFLGSPMKRKHVLRTARQARQMAELDG